MGAKPMPSDKEDGGRSPGGSVMRQEIGSEPGSGSQTEADLSLLRRRRASRVGFIWLLVLVFGVGNVLDWFGWHSWGPLQNSDQGVWVHGAAALFWLALAMLSLCVRDLVSLLVHRSQPPTFENLPGGTKWWTRIIADPARRWLGAYQGLVGIAGLIGGAVLGHFLWKP